MDQWSCTGWSQTGFLWIWYRGHTQAHWSHCFRKLESVLFRWRILMNLGLQSSMQWTLLSRGGILLLYRWKKACLHSGKLSKLKDLEVVVLNGDIAKKMFIRIVKSETGRNLIPSIATYKLRKNVYIYHGIRVLLSYIVTVRTYRSKKRRGRWSLRI